MQREELGDTREVKGGKNPSSSDLKGTKKNKRRRGKKSEKRSADRGNSSQRQGLIRFNQGSLEKEVGGEARQRPALSKVQRRKGEKHDEGGGKQLSMRGEKTPSSQGDFIREKRGAE